LTDPPVISYNATVTEKATPETTITKLEKIVTDLSAGKGDIEEDLKKFKEGAALVKKGNEQLKHAENEFKKIKAELEHGD
jgi:exodeoxyribonuclease VII small subunit